MNRARMEAHGSAGARGRSRSDIRALWHRLRHTTGSILRWVVLIDFAYVFVFPVIYMVTTSIQTMSDINNPAVHWISRTPTFEGYQIAITALGYWDGLYNSALTSVLAAVGQTLVGAMVAYGLARLRFPGRDLIFGLLLFTIVVPAQTIIVPQFMLYVKLKWVDSFIPLIAPACMGWGVRGAVLLIVYRQFFRGLPYELEDAAYVDGAGPLRTFWEIMLPLAKPAILVVMLFSLVWTWNDTLVPWLVLRSDKLMTLSQRIEVFYFMLNRENPQLRIHVEPNVFMAATTLCALPLLVIYMFAQRHFTQSIDRTGLVE